MSEPIPTILVVRLDPADLKLLRYMAECANKSLDVFVTAHLIQLCAIERRVHRAG